MKNIILAEDNPKIMTLLKDAFLTVWDHEILEVENGVEAIDILQEKPEEISLVISDYSMPHMNGIDVYQWIKQNSPKTPFFLLNGGEIPDPESITEISTLSPKSMTPIYIQRFSNSEIASTALFKRFTIT